MRVIGAPYVLHNLFFMPMPFPNSTTSWRSLELHYVMAYFLFPPAGGISVARDVGHVLSNLSCDAWLQGNAPVAAPRETLTIFRSCNFLVCSTHHSNKPLCAHPPSILRIIMLLYVESVAIRIVVRSKHTSQRDAMLTRKWITCTALYIVYMLEYVRYSYLLSITRRLINVHP